MVDSLGEREIKERVNRLRTEIDAQQNALGSLYENIKIYRRGADEWRTKRDSLNTRVKEYSEKARVHREKRDQVNEEIQRLKARRDVIRTARGEGAEEIKRHKQRRNHLQKDARGTQAGLTTAYEESIRILLEEEIPLHQETRLAERVLELAERLRAAKEADSAHQEVVSTFENLQNIGGKADEIYQRIQELAEESQQHHEAMLQEYKEVDRIRQEADLAHTHFVEKLEAARPLGEQIQARKETVKRLQDEIDLYLERLEVFQLERDQRRREERKAEAEVKMKTGSRMSLDDLRLLLDQPEED